MTNNAVQYQQNILWAPQPGPQTAMIACPVFELFYGGARGGGKTDGMLGDWLDHSATYGEAAVGVFFRRTYKQLSEVIARSHQLFPKIGALWNGERGEWRMPDIGRGHARLLFRHLERDADAENYQGHNYSRVYIEEATNFPSAAPINKLRATVRSTTPGIRVGMRLTGNPGGPGHAWVKKRYIDPHPPGYKILIEEFENPWTGEKIALERVFIPAKLIDNQLLMKNQPTYIAQLQQTGSKQLVDAWLMGRWEMIAGAFFTEFDPIKHIITANAMLTVRPHFMMFRAMDWGFAKPFSVGWYVISDGTWDVPGFGPIREGAIVKVREWYGCTGTPNEGLRLDANVVANGIKAIDRELADGFGLRVRYGVADPAIFARDGGPSIAEAMFSSGVMWNRADNQREPGWQQVRHRLNGTDGVPLLYFLETCDDTARTLPVLQHGTLASRNEDLDSEGEDHAADELRYACMSRPWVVKAKEGAEALRFPKLPAQMTFNDLLAMNRKKRLSSEDPLGV
jgi:hypothetical protein